MARRLDGVRPVRLSPRLATIVASGVVVVLAVADMFVMNAAGNARDEASARNDAMHSARTLVPVLLSYDHSSLTADLERARKTTTGKFRGDFDKLVTAVVRPTATKRRVSTKAVVSSVGVISSSADKVTILVFVTQTSTSSANKSPVLSGSRVKVLMTRVAGRWLVGGLDPV